MRAAWDDKHAQVDRETEFIAPTTMRACIEGVPGTRRELDAAGLINDGYEDENFKQQYPNEAERKDFINQRRKLCISVLLSYGLAPKRITSSSLYLAGLMYLDDRRQMMFFFQQQLRPGRRHALQHMLVTKPEPAVPPNIFSLLHAAGLTDLNEWLGLITYIRIKADGGNPSHPWINERRMDLMEMHRSIDSEAKDFWNYLETHQALKDICDKHRAMKEGTSVLPLIDMCRDFIRSQLMSINKQNLFVLLPKLPLPKPMQSILLYGEELST